MKLLIVDELHPSIHMLLAEAEIQFDYLPELGYAEALDIIPRYEGLLIRSKFCIDDAFLERALKLSFIGRAGAGLDLIDVAACERRGIAVFGANEANKVAVAEHVLGMVLNLFHRISQAQMQVKSGLWLREENRGEELSGKTVGIIGYGNNGSETARRFSAFGCNVLAYDKYVKGYGSASIAETHLEDIFYEADLISFHIPLTPETKGWVNQAFLARFRKPIYVCNAARGEIIVLADLVAALASGTVKGACLDVLENEKLGALSEEQKRQFHFLVEHPRVLVTPHVAGWTFESYEKINRVLVSKIVARFKP